MRVIGGRLGGRRFDGPPGNATRPTSDRVREGVASALASRAAFDDAVVLDLFAGTGAWAFEAISRGARHAVLIDRDRRVVQSIQHNADALDIADQCVVIQGDLFADGAPWLKRAPLGLLASLIFIDPPYAEITKVPALLTALVKHDAVAPDAWFVLERASRDAAVSAHFLAAIASYRYGDTTVDLFRLQPGAVPA